MWRRVAVAQQVKLEDVSLAGPGGQAGAGPHPLDVDDHDRDLGEVGQADELGHERDARPGGGRQRPGPGPARADGHADGRQLVLGLDDGERPACRPGSTRCFLRNSSAYSARLLEGVIGYQVSTLAPPNSAPSAAALFPSIRILSLVDAIRLTWKGRSAGRFSSAHSIAGPRGVDVDLAGLGLAAGKLAPDACLDRLELDLADRRPARRRTPC